MLQLSEVLKLGDALPRVPLGDVPLGDVPLGWAPLWSALPPVGHGGLGEVCERGEVCEIGVASPNISGCEHANIFEAWMRHYVKHVRHATTV